MLYFAYSAVLQPLMGHWQEAAEYDQRSRKKIRKKLLSEARVSLNNSLSLIATLVAIAPLLGLLGTIMGMVQIFDVVAVSGSGNVREMASGVGQCTLSTMAGLVVALSGLYFVSLLSKRVESLLESFSRKLSLE